MPDENTAYLQELVTLARKQLELTEKTHQLQFQNQATAALGSLDLLTKIREQPLLGSDDLAQFQRAEALMLEEHEQRARFYEQVLAALDRQSKLLEQVLERLGH